MPTAVIGRQVCELRKLHLRPYELAFLTRGSEHEVKLRIRRGRRLADEGLTHDEILERGAIAIASGTSVPVGLAAELLEGDELALLVLAAIAEGRVSAPRARSPKEQAPDLLSVVSKL